MEKSIGGESDVPLAAYIDSVFAGATSDKVSHNTQAISTSVTEIKGQTSSATWKF